MLVLDSQNRLRLYQIEQIGSDRESFTVERYYDVRGTLRFVYVDRVITNIRIYLNGAGNVVWAVEQHENKFTVFESDKEDWEMNPNTANKANEEFQEQRLCPEITKQSTAQPRRPSSTSLNGATTRCSSNLARLLEQRVVAPFRLVDDGLRGWAVLCFVISGHSRCS